MDYVVQDVDLSREYKAHKQLSALEVGQSFTFPEDRLNYFRHRASKQGKLENRVYSVNKANLSVTRKK